MTDIKTPQEAASAVLEVIPNYRRWVKGAYDVGNGRRHCLVGAIMCLCQKERSTKPYQVSGNWLEPCQVSWLNMASDFSNLLLAVIESEYPERPRDLVGFNDHHDTHYSDIRRILEKVAAG